MVSIIGILLVLIVLSYTIIQVRAIQSEEWKFTTSGYAWYNSVSEDGKFIVTATSDGQIYFYRKNGELLWKKNIEDIFDLYIAPDASFIAVSFSRDHKTGGVLFLDRNGNTIRETIVRTDDDFVKLSFCREELFFCAFWSSYTSDESFLYLINGDGRIEWERKFYNDFTIPKFLGADSILIYFHIDNSYQMLDREGNLLWSYRFPVNTRVEAISGNGQYVAILTNVGDLYYFNRKGKILWSVHLAHDFRAT